MRKKLALVFAFLCVAMLITSAVMAEDTKKTIDAYFNSMKIKINGTNVGMDNILYDNTLYVPLRIVAQIFDKDVTFDAETRSVAIDDKPERDDGSKKAPADDTGIKSIVFLLSNSFFISGLILLAQTGILRSRKNLKFLGKLTQRTDGVNPGIKRLLYEKWTTRIGFYYLLIGVIMHLPGFGSAYTIVKIIFILLSTLSLWFFGTWLSKDMTSRQFPDILEAYKRNTSGSGLPDFFNR